MTTCRECKKGCLLVIDVDDCSLTVECSNCLETYQIEPDGFNDGGFAWAQAMADKEAGLFDID